MCGLLTILVRTYCVRRHVVRARADVVATKLGINLLLSFSFFLSVHLPAGRGLPTILNFSMPFLVPKKIRFSHKKRGGPPLPPPYCHLWADSRHVKRNGVHALWESEDHLWRTRYFLCITTYTRTRLICFNVPARTSSCRNRYKGGLDHQPCPSYSQIWAETIILCT